MAPGGRLSLSTLLRVDSGGGLLAGALVLGLQGPLAALHGLPVEAVRLIAAANLLYGCYSGALVWLTPPVRRGPTWALVAANLGWSVVCAALLVRYRAEVGATGLLHVGGEGLYVAGLAVLEARALRVSSSAR